MSRFDFNSFVESDGCKGEDCFIGALASNLLEKQDLSEAAIFANKAAAISVTKKGASASMPTTQEVLKFG